MRTIMKFIAVVGSTVVLVGCGDEPTRTTQMVDQCMRQKLFSQCLAAVPSGPTITHDNPWDEVMKQCGQQAYYQSIRITEHIDPQCRAY